MWMVPAAMAVGSMFMADQQNRQVRDQNRRQADMAAAQTQFSPWTKLGAGKANYQSEQSLMGAGMQGGVSGMGMAQSYDQAQANEALGKAQLDYYRQNTFNPYTYNRSQNNHSGMA